MPFNADIVCHVPSTESTYHGRLRDISALGVFVEAENTPEMGCACELHIALKGTSSRLVIDQLKGKVVRLVEGGMAISFEDRLEWIALVPIYFHKMKK